MVKIIKRMYAKLRKAEETVDLLQKFGLDPDQPMVKAGPRKPQLIHYFDPGEIAALVKQAAVECEKMQMTARLDANNDAYHVPKNDQFSQSEQLYIEQLLVLYQPGKLIFEAARSAVKAKIQERKTSITSFDKDDLKESIEKELLAFRKMDGQPHITLGQYLGDMENRLKDLNVEYRKFNALLGNMETNTYLHKPPVRRMVLDYPEGYAATMGALGIWEAWINLDAALESDYIGGNSSKIIVVVIFGAGMATATHLLGSGYHFKNKKWMVTGGVIGGLLFLAVTSLRIVAAKFDPVIFVATILLFLLGVLCAIARSRHGKYWGLKGKVDSLWKEINGKQGQISKLKEAVKAYADKSAVAELRILKQTQASDEGILEGLEKSFVQFREKMKKLANEGLVSYRYNYYDELRRNHKTIDASKSSQPPLLTDMDMDRLPAPKGDMTSGLTDRNKSIDTPPADGEKNNDAAPPEEDKNNDGK